MILQIALSYDKACEEDLLKRGFKKQEVYVKPAPEACDLQNRELAGLNEFHHMRNRPFEYAVTTFHAVKMD